MIIHVFISRVLDNGRRPDKKKKYNITGCEHCHYFVEVDIKGYGKI